MKKFLLYISVIVSSSLFISCEKDNECHECHIAIMMQDGSEHEHEIGEFCGEDLEDVESNGYTVMEEFDHMGILYVANQSE